MSITLSALQKQRRDSAANWTAENPTLLAGEIGIESDTGYWKVGDGSTAWTSLAYVSGLGAEIPVSRLADGSARQLLQTAANGNDVEWTSNVDIPGTLDVTGAATFDAAVTIQGDLTVNGTTTTIDTQNLIVEDKNVIIGQVTTPTDITADGGGITLKGTTDKTINWVDATDAWTSSERFSVPLGTAAAPSLTFTGDPNTGIYSPGADQVAISTNGTGRLFVDSSGAVGVGLSPTVALDINAPGTSPQIKLARTGGIDMRLNAYYGNADLAALSVVTNHPLAFFTNNTERLRITSDGKLGLGTSTPRGRRLNVSADSLAVSSNPFGDFQGNGQLFITGATNSDKTLALGVDTTLANMVGVIQSMEAAVTARALALNPSGGNVGVGTTSPQDALNVSDGTATFQLKPIGASSVGFFGMRTNHALGFTTNDTERARIDSSGRLLVGTSSDSGGALLQVNGDRIRVGTAKTPASATATGTAGEICWDASYVYVCTATNTWKRSALSTW